MALILNRKTDEKIYIGDNITITVLEIIGRYAVKLAIEAPAGVKIVRAELAELPRPAVRPEQKGA